jgi:hypothetical protein
MLPLAELARLTHLDPKRAIAVPSGGGGLLMHELDVDPYDFLLLAEEDWERGGLAAELNAITNAKRAIVAQMDQALLSFGYPAIPWNVPKKIETLQSLGLVTPRILRRVSATRNLLEHEYRRPSFKDVEDAIDLAALFVASIKPLLMVFGDQFSVGNADESEDAFSFAQGLEFSMLGSPNSDRPTFLVWARVRGEVAAETRIDYRQREFPVIVRLAIATDRGFKLNEALSDFLALLTTPNP